MKKILSFVFVLLSALVLTGCDEHEPVDMDIHVGYILCDDGRIISEQVFDNGHYTPVGVVFAPKTEDHEVLVVMLKEYYNLQFATKLAFDQGTSCDDAAYDGYLNTVALQAAVESYEVEVQVDDSTVVTETEYDYSPLADRAFSSHYFWQSDYVPSVAEMGLLYLAKDAVNPVLEKCGGDPLVTEPGRPGVWHGQSCWYWTSTEVKENRGNQAWLFSMADGSRHRTPKTNSYNMRLVVEYNPLNVK